MRKILIADSSDDYSMVLAGALRSRFQVVRCSDGGQALALLRSMRPDVLIMDLMLSGTDGLSVLKALEQRTPRPRIIITGRYFSNFMTTALERYQVDDVLLKPCDIQAVTGRVAEVLAQEEPIPVTCPDPYDHITALLVSLGAPTSQQGFRFLRSGILLLMADPSQQLTKVLYPAIAEEYGTNTVNVEKALRTTVTTAWLSRRDSVWRSYFPPAPTGQIPRPTAGQFLTRLADAVQSAIRRQA